MTFIQRASLAGAAVGSLFAAMLAFRPASPNAAQPATTSQSGPAATPASQPSPSDAGKNKWSEDGPWKASRQHFAGIQPEYLCPSLDSESRSDSAAASRTATSASQPPGDGNTFNNARGRIWCIPDGVQVRAMIAIAPDPVHSHLSLVFDRTIEALQLSAEAVNYEMDRYWLPWRPPTAAGSAVPNVRAVESRQKEPGLLLFRWNGPADATVPKVLYVFLVSDTATAGINGYQFANAVQYVQQVCSETATVSGCGKDNRILVMGPTFSGSLASFRQLTDAPAQGGIDFIAYSGTVSSTCALENQGVLGQAPLSSSCLGRTRPAPARHLQVTSLVGDSATMVQDFIQDLRSKGNIQCQGTNEVAVLSEAATTYGGTVTNVHNGGCSYASFSYPREISSLRNASAANSASLAAAQTQPQTSTSPVYLPFTLVDRQPNYGDETPEFSLTQGPLSKEAILMRYAAKLRTDHYKYVGIIGTNVVDVLYLAKFLRSACPDVRLFILNSDLLFERDLDNAPYIGTVSLSTYALFGHDPDWSRQVPNRLQLPFADQYEQGQYNASLLVMQDVLQSGTTIQPRNLSLPSLGLGYGAAGKLPAWETVVGTGGYWPIQLLAPPRSVRDQPKPQLEDSDFSPAWRAISLLLAALAFLQSWILWTRAQRLGDFSIANVAPEQRFFFINVALVSLALMLFFLVAPALKFGPSSGLVFGVVVVVLLAILSLVLASLRLRTLLSRIQEAETDPHARRSYRRSLFFTFLVWVTAGLSALFWWNLHADDPSHYGFFFGYRVLNLATGVSPLMPLLPLLFSVYLWSVCEIWRLRFDDQIRPRLKVSNGFPGASTESAIASAVNKYLLEPDYQIGFIIVWAVWLFFYAPSHPVNLFEQGGFSALYSGALCLVVALMLSAGFRLGQTWSRLKLLLNQLELSPLRLAFSQIPDQETESSSPLISLMTELEGGPIQWANMNRSLELLVKIRNSSPHLDGDLSASIYEAMEAKALLQNKSQQYKIQKTVFNLGAVVGQLQAALSSVLDKALKVLDSYWRLHGPIKQEEQSSEDLLQLRPLEEFAVFQYFIFIDGIRAHTRRVVLFLVTSFTLLLLSLNVYAFEPHVALAWSFTIIFAAIGLVVVNVLMQVHRNEILSRIDGTKPNQLGSEFYLKVALLGAGPLVSLLAAHFPSIARFFLSYLQPGLEALK